MGTVCLDDPPRAEPARPRAHVFTRIRETWLTRAPRGGEVISGFSVLLLALGSLAYWDGIAGADRWMAASGESVFGRGEWWRLWTTLFAHADLGHLLSNSLLFFVLGALLAGHFGAFVFPVASFVLGGVVNAMILKTYDPAVRLIGASGVVFLMGGIWLTLYLLIHRERTFGQRALRSLGVALALFMPTQAFDPSVSYRTHALGFAAGVAFALLYFLRNKSFFRSAEIVETVVEEDESAPPF